ncbi:MAG: hypothetical protein N3D10_01170, partial [Candidatus Micrarchaeota archaeon]|nr:hypothetical protein [Candidatus Micrarchaeota archaeon]
MSSKIFQNKNLLFVPPSLAASLANLLSPTEAEGRLPSKNSFFTQNLGQDSTIIKNYTPNVTVFLKTRTHFFDIYVDTLRILQRFNYSSTQENKVDLFEANTNLKYLAFLSIGKDTTLNLVATDPKTSPFDTIKINGKKINLITKKGDVIETDLQSLIKVKKINNNLYQVEFGFEKYGFSPADTTKLINMIIDFGEVYERHLNAIIGEFRKDKLEFLAYEGKNQG